MVSLSTFRLLLAMSSISALAAHADVPSLDVLAAPHSTVFDPSMERLAPLEAVESAQGSEDATSFDMYVLAQSWQPAFCHGKEKQYPGCKTPQPYWRTHFTLHGLWPERADSAPPSFCSDEAFDAATIERELGIATLHQYWPDVKFSEASPEYPDFWQHEWKRHGTCSGLPQVQYFTDAVNLVRNETLAPTPQLVRDHVGGQVTTKELREAFGDAALKCDRGREENGAGKSMPRLSQVFTCWEKDEHNVPTKRGACTEQVRKEDTCGQGSVQIPAFPAAN